ncbi:hypothetical protein [Thalassococcus arenae]|uniref:hypothetical protein n=1 Tax=Thalassococcus arenae TaxID=2851652 RepID=UPI0020CB1457|nr:hypothetical protein [Thalassococcus arenae]
MRRLAGLGLLLLAACGADGEPERPEPPRVTTQVSVGSDGVSTSTTITQQRGSFTLGVGL